MPILFILVAVLFAGGLRLASATPQLNRAKSVSEANWNFRRMLLLMKVGSRQVFPLS